METVLNGGDPDRISRLELISLYINDYYALDANSRSQFEAAFRKRKLPLPRMPERSPQASSVAAPKPMRIDRGTFISYILLIYSGTAVVYSWIYLIERFVKMDFRENARHKLIQSGIALFYITAEILLFDYFSRLE